MNHHLAVNMLLFFGWLFAAKMQWISEKALIPIFLMLILFEVSRILDKMEKQEQSK